MKKVLAIILTLCMLISVIPMALTVSAEAAVSNLVFDLGDMENDIPGILENSTGGKATSIRSSEAKKNGNFSNKMYFPDDAKGNIVLWVESNTNYDNLPLDEYVYVTFWAKADDETGFRGAVLVNDTAQYDSNKQNKERIDGWSGQFGIGSGLAEDGWADVSKVWTKYYVPVSSKTLTDTETVDYEILVSMIYFTGKGTIYIDDINVEAQNPSLVDYGNFETGDAFIGLGGDATLGRTSEESKTGRYSAKYVGTASNHKEVFIVAENKYNDIPRGKQVALTFWAKAGAEGFTGMFGTNNLAQGIRNSWWSDRYRLDDYYGCRLYAFGGIDKTDINTANYETLPTEWTKYYLFMPIALIESEDYSCVFAQVDIKGTGTFYIDDINIELVDDLLDNGTVNDGGAEKSTYSYEFPENVTVEKVNNEKFNGKYSTKFSSTGNALAKLDMRIDSTGDHYAKIPLNQQLYITFWAKADDETGFSGAIGSGIIYQLPSVEDSGKRDGYAMTTAFGSSDMSESGFVAISKEWTKYYIKVNNFFTDGFESAYAYIKINGYGSLYIDDIAFETIDEEILDNTGYGANIDLGNINLSAKSANYGNTLTSDVFAQSSLSQSIKVNNKTANEVIGNLIVDVKNSAGEKVHTEYFSVNISAREYAMFDFTIPGLTEYGKYTVVYTYTDAKSTHTAETEFSNVKKSASNSGIYNICLDLGSETDARYDSIFEALSNSGVEYFRIDMSWDKVEKTAGNYEFPEYFARMFASAQKYNMKPLVIVTYKNGLYGDVNNNNFFADSNAVTAYAAFAAKIVETYVDYIDAIEIYNEPNYLNVTAAQYANMLRESYTAIKNVKDSVKVVGGVTSGADSEYIGDILDNGAGNYMDVVSVHPYVYTNILNNKPEKIVDNIVAVRNTLTSKNCNKPIWITEINWPTNDSLYGYTETEQSEYLTRAMLALQGENCVEKIFVYTAADNDTGNEDTEKVFGIFKSANYTTANAAKLSYVALSQFASATYGKKADGAVTVGNNIKAYKYSNDANTITAVWSTGSKVTVNWNVSDSVKIYDIYGNLMYVSANNGTAQITVGSAPIYIVNYNNGDVTEDSNVDIMDLIRIKKNFVNNICSDVMDITKDYAVNSSDMVQLRKILLNK